nr:uncharacterized protein LOC109157166 [Ipomoea batatas]
MCNLEALHANSLDEDEVYASRKNLLSPLLKLNSNPGRDACAAFGPLEHSPLSPANLSAQRLFKMLGLCMEHRTKAFDLERLLDIYEVLFGIVSSYHTAYWLSADVSSNTAVASGSLILAAVIVATWDYIVLNMFLRSRNKVKIVPFGIRSATEVTDEKPAKNRANNSACFNWYLGEVNPGHENEGAANEQLMDGGFGARIAEVIAVHTQPENEDDVNVQIPLVVACEEVNVPRNKEKVSKLPIIKRTTNNNSKTKD